MAKASILAATAVGIAGSIGLHFNHPYQVGHLATAPRSGHSLHNSAQKVKLFGMSRLVKGVCRKVAKRNFGTEARPGMKNKKDAY